MELCGWPGEIVQVPRSQGYVLLSPSDQAIFRRLSRMDTTHCSLVSADLTAVRKRSKLNRHSLE